MYVCKRNTVPRNTRQGRRSNTSKGRGSGDTHRQQTKRHTHVCTQTRRRCWIPKLLHMCVRLPKQPSKMKSGLRTARTPPFENKKKAVCGVVGHFAPRFLTAEKSKQMTACHAGRTNASNRPREKRQADRPTELPGRPSPKVPSIPEESACMGSSLRRIKYQGPT